MKPIPTAISFALILSLATIPLPAQAQTGHPFMPLKASDLLGKRVEDSDGQELGTLRNLVLDTNSGRLKYVILGSGGFLGLGTKLKIAPPQVLSAATTKRGILAINVSRSRWQNAPTFSASQLASLGRSDRAEQIARYYAEPTADTRIAQNPGRENELTLTGVHSGKRSPTRVMELRLASDIIGQRVINWQGEKIGEVLDVLVTFDDSHPVFALVSSGRLFRNGEHQYAVPLPAFARPDDGKKLILNADRATLQRLKPFSSAAGNSSDDNQIYRFDSGQHAANWQRHRDFHPTKQPTNEKENYGKGKFIGGSLA